MFSSHWWCWNYYNSWIWVYDFYQICKIFGYYFFKHYFPALFSLYKTLIAHTFSYFNLFHIWLILSSFFSPSLIVSLWITFHCYVEFISPIFFTVRSNLLLFLFSIFFISDIIVVICRSLHIPCFHLTSRTYEILL